MNIQKLPPAIATWFRNFDTLHAQTLQQMEGAKLLIQLYLPKKSN